MGVIPSKATMQRRAQQSGPLKTTVTQPAGPNGPTVRTQRWVSKDWKGSFQTQHAYVRPQGLPTFQQQAISAQRQAVPQQLPEQMKANLVAKYKQMRANPSQIGPGATRVPPGQLPRFPPRLPPRAGQPRAKNNQGGPPQAVRAKNGNIYASATSALRP